MKQPNNAWGEFHFRNEKKARKFDARLDCKGSEMNIKKQMDIGAISKIQFKKFRAGCNRNWRRGDREQGAKEVMRKGRMRVNREMLGKGEVRRVTLQVGCLREPRQRKVTCFGSFKLK